MKKIFYLVISLLLSVSLMAQEKQDLKILYISGSADYEVGTMKYTPEGIAERTASFTEFLNGYFTKVDVVAGTEYKPEMSKDYDVTILDGRLSVLSPSYFSGSNYYLHRMLTDDFCYPTLMIADNAERVTRSIGTKTDWYCLCLDNYAFGTNTEHPIFNTPYKVSLNFTDKPTPPGALQYAAYYGKPISKTTPMWKVQTKGYGEDPESHDPKFRIGMVARPGGFLDSPDAEIISGGKSQKSIDAVAIGRHGNFFFWGFSASPKYMTDEAKLVFANAVVYTASLKGEKILARKYNDRFATREESVSFKLNSATKEAYQASLEAEQTAYKDIIATIENIKKKKENGEKLSEMEQSYLTMKPQEPQTPTFEEYLKDVLGKNYEEYGSNLPKYHKMIKADEPYLYGALSYQPVIDEDVKSLKIANNDIRILDKAISMLEKGKDVEKAQRILDRYTLATFEKPEQWRKWYDTYKEKMFFTESGGWVFLINTKDPSVEGNDYFKKQVYMAAKAIKLDEVTDQEPVSIGASWNVFYGGAQYVVIKARIKDGYHIYEAVSPNDPFAPTTISIELPESVTLGTPIKPDAKLIGNGTAVYENEVIFVYPLNTPKIVSGPIKVIVNYQCCDKNVCLLPTEKAIELKMEMRENNR